MSNFPHYNLNWSTINNSNMSVNEQQKMMSQHQGQQAAAAVAQSKQGAPHAQERKETAPPASQSGEPSAPARALNTDPNYKSKEAGTWDEQKDKRETGMNFDKDETASMDRSLQPKGEENKFFDGNFAEKKSSDDKAFDGKEDKSSDENKDDEDKTVWEKFKEGAVEFENRVASALKPLEERVNNATTEVTDAVKETGDDMNKSVREYDASEEAKKEAEKEQKAQKEQAAM